MNGTTLLIWINIVIVGLIAIVAVKLYYRRNDLEKDEGSIITGDNSIQSMLSSGKDKIIESSRDLSKSNASSNYNRSKNSPASLRKEGAKAQSYDAYIVPEVGANNSNNIEYHSQNQVLINYGNDVKRFQEPIKQNQMDIMTQNNKPADADDSKHELKDLFTIDELIKESKRKDDEREKESKTIKKEDDGELEELKESIKMRRENKDAETNLIEEVESEPESIADIIKEDGGDIADAIKEEESEKIKIESSASQKDINEAIESAAEESEEEIDIAEKSDITSTLLDSEEEKEEEIKTPALKSPTKISDKKDGVTILSGEDEDYKFGGQLEDSELFKDDDDMNDLDYRKDLAKITNTLKKSRIFQDVKEKLTPPSEEIEERVDESYIRNVNEYDEYEPIINETHMEFDDIVDNTFDSQLREENTRKVFKNDNLAPELDVANPVSPIKEKPSRANIKIQLNNNEVVLKKGDEIIFKHDGETYSSQVYSINGDDISVRYRRKNITIKPEDVKKVY